MIVHRAPLALVAAAGRQRSWRLAVALGTALAAAPSAATASATSPAAGAATERRRPARRRTSRRSSSAASTACGRPRASASSRSPASSWAWPATGPSRWCSAGQISHNPNLGSQVSGNWTKLGENVGVGYDVDGLMQAFINSPAHYRNLVDPEWNYIARRRDRAPPTAASTRPTTSWPWPPPAPPPPPTSPRRRHHAPSPPGPTPTTAPPAPPPTTTAAAAAARAASDHRARRPRCSTRCARSSAG